MGDPSLEKPRTAGTGESGAGAGAGAADRAGPKRGLGWPRLYDLLMLILTRGRSRAYREEQLELAGVAPGRSMLDIGCGSGSQAIAAWRRSQPGGSVVGVDISPKMLEVARRKARRAGVDVPFRRADAASLPFGDERFDIVTITTVLHMIPAGTRGLCLREAARVLRPGGRLLLIDYAGAREERSGWIAKHGLHGRFDLDGLHEPLCEEGFGAIDRGPLNWLGLHFLRGIKGAA